LDLALELRVLEGGLVLPIPDRAGSK